MKRVILIFVLFPLAVRVFPAENPGLRQYGYSGDEQKGFNKLSPEIVPAKYSYGFRQKHHDFSFLNAEAFWNLLDFPFKTNENNNATYKIFWPLGIYQLAEYV